MPVRDNKCVNCGAEGASFQNLCQNCYLNDHPIVLRRGRFKIPKCRECGNVYYNGSWSHAGIDPDRQLLQGIKDRIIKSYKFSTNRNLKIKIIKVVYEDYIASISSTLATNGILLTIYPNLSDLTKLKLEDSYAEKTYTFVNPEDWIVLVFDYDERKVIVYDKYYNKLLETTLEIGYDPGTSYWIEFYVYNDESYIVNDMEIDWIAVLEPPNLITGVRGDIGGNIEYTIYSSSSNSGISESQK